jgi:hypothetical protein
MMRISHFSPAALALLLACSPRAETAAAPKVERAEGVVTRISASEISLSEAGGKTETITLRPGWTVAVSRPISIDQIKPGSYLGTTNHAGPDATGRSTEVHLSPNGIKGPGLDFVMDPVADTTMTNGTVVTVATTAGGQVLKIDYGSGVRTVTVPPGTPLVLNTPGSQDLVKVGQTVRVIKFTPAGGGEARQFITVGENGAPPPPA